MKSPLALDVPEILAEILSHLSVPDLLLRVRLVNRYWQQVVDTSPQTLWATWRSPHLRISHDIEAHTYLLDQLQPKLRSLHPDIYNSAPFFEGFLYDQWSMTEDLNNLIRQQGPSADVICDGCREPLKECTVYQESQLDFCGLGRVWDVITDRFRLSRFRVMLKSTYITRPPLKKIRVKGPKHTWSVDGGLGYSYDGDEDLVIEDARGITVDSFLRQLGHWYRRESWGCSELDTFYLINVSYHPISVNASKHEAEFKALLGSEDARGPRGEGRAGEGTQFPPDYIIDALRRYTFKKIENKCRADNLGRLRPPG